MKKTDVPVQIKVDSVRMRNYNMEYYSREKKGSTHPLAPSLPRKDAGKRGKHSPPGPLSPAKRRGKEGE